MAKKNQSSCMNCSAIPNDRKLYNSFNGKSQNHIRSLCTPENELYRDVNKTGSYQVSMAYGFLSRVEFSRRVMLLASDSPYGLGIACAAA